MLRLEELIPGIVIKGIIPNQKVTVVNVKWHGNDVVELIYKDSSGQPHTELLFRDREIELEAVVEKKPWSLEAEGELFRLVSEAHRISLAHLFEP